MKRLLIFLLCSLMALSSLSFAVGAAETDTADVAADVEVTDEAADIEAADVAADTDIAESGAEAADLSDTGYTLLSEAQFQSKLSALRSKYPNGSVWEGLYYEDGYVKATTCWAYAAQMLYEIFGVRFYGDRMLDNKYYDTSGITAGDWVRIDWDSHSIFITKVTGDGVYYTDGNGTGIYNQVRWDGFYSWSELNSRFSYRLHLPGNDLMGVETTHTIAYNANGGSGSVSSTTLTAGKGFTVKDSSFSRSGYSFEGYTVKRSSDNKWFCLGGKGWQSEDDIINNGYEYAIYYPGESYKMSANWLGEYTASTTFTFYAQWLPYTSTLEFAANYSGYNYMLGSDLKSGYDKYIYPRDTSVYSVSVDSTEKLNNASSLKITGKSAGSMGKDLAFITSTNKGYGNGYSPAGVVGDDATFTLHFYAKSSVDGAKMYFRWGYTSEFVSVTLSKNWKTYAVDIPKNRYCGYAIHPYFDKAGTYYLNSLALSDIPWVSNVIPESGTWAAFSMKVTRGDAPGTLPTPKRDGYTFDGWYTAAEDGEEVTAQSVIDEPTLRLYAHWRKNVSYEPIKTVKYNGHMYELYDNALEWEDASLFCAMMGGHLVTLSDSAENDFVYDMIRDRQGYCWIGLYCADEKTDWQWVDDTKLSSYNKWYKSSYATTDTGEYHGMLYAMNFGTTPYASTWDKCVGSNYFCSYYGYHNSYFVCEYDDPYFLGDIDGSGEVDSLDALTIQRHCAGMAISTDENRFKYADVNGDDAVDIIDATLICRYLAKQETDYAIGEWIR